MKRAWGETADVYRMGSRSPMRPEEMASEISDALPADGILVTDTGHSGMWTGQMVELRHPGQRYIRCAGTLGWGLPGAIGVQCAAADRKVVLWTGDGGLYYHLAELETAARCGINLVVVCNNNSSLNQEYNAVFAAHGGKLGPRSREIYGFRDTDFAKVAEDLGCVGLRATTRSQFREALAHALRLDRPVVIDAVTDASALAPLPWIPAAKA
jgi:acetolactate synthase-1/2/3 large subunit